MRLEASGSAKRWWSFINECHQVVGLLRTWKSVGARLFDACTTGRRALQHLDAAFVSSGVNRAASRPSRRARNVRFTSNSVRTLAPQRNDATCHEQRRSGEAFIVRGLLQKRGVLRSRPRKTRPQASYRPWDTVTCCVPTCTSRKHRSSRVFS